MQVCQFWLQTESDWLQVGQFWDFFRPEIQYICLPGEPNVFVPFGAILTQFGAKPDRPAPYVTFLCQNLNNT